MEESRMTTVIWMIRIKKHNRKHEECASSNYHTKYLVKDHWLAQVGFFNTFCQNWEIDEQPSHHSSSYKEKSVEEVSTILRSTTFTIKYDWKLSSNELKLKSHVIHSPRSMQSWATPFKDVSRKYDWQTLINYYLMWLKELWCHAWRGKWRRKD